MKRIASDGPVYYQFDLLAKRSDMTHGVFTRLGGVSQPPYDTLNVGSTVGDDLASVQANRERMAGALGYREADTRTTWQVHGADVVVARRHSPQQWPPSQADAIITAERDLPLVMRYADCVPLVFYDPVKQAVGLAHAGWRGVVAGVGPATLKAMEGAFGSDPADVLVGIGPSIGGCCFEVGPEVVRQFEEALGSLDGLARPGNGDEHRPHLDLWAANERALRQAGAQRIEIAGICTATSKHEFFSHRAERGKTGRFGVMIALRGQ